MIQIVVTPRVSGCASAPISAPHQQGSSNNQVPIGRSARLRRR